MTELERAVNEPCFPCKFRGLSPKTRDLDRFAHAGWHFGLRVASLLPSPGDDSTLHELEAILNEALVSDEVDELARWVSREFPILMAALTPPQRDAFVSGIVDAAAVFNLTARLSIEEPPPAGGAA